MNRTILFVTAVFALASGCGTTRVAQYPDDWPPLTSGGSCDEVRDVYVNAAVAVTSSDPTGRRQPEKAYLTSMLVNGTSGTHDEQQSAIHAVRIGVGGTIHAEPKGSNATPVKSEGHWSCTADGSMAIRFERETQSEYTVAQSVQIELTLYKAADRSLIVRQRITVRGVGQFFLPFRDESVAWKRFARVNS